MVTSAHATKKLSHAGNKTDILNNMKKILVIVIVGLLITAGIGYFLWNKPHRTAEDEKPFATVTANQLYTEFSADEPAAWTKYKDKVIQINGEVQSISTDASGNTQVVLNTEDPMNTVSVTLMAGATAPAQDAGTMIEVKGICNGFLNDIMGEVQLNQGVVVTNTK
jgi:uncharacterized protein YxeA